MKRPQILSLHLLSALTLPTAQTAGSAPARQPEPHSIAQLEQRLAEIDAELEQLAAYSLRRGFGSVGYASRSVGRPDHKEWIHINLEQPTPIDQIVLVPSIARDAEDGFRANGFPREFRILTGSGPGTEEETAASFGESDHLQPRIAPLIVPCSVTASWVRVEASLLSQRIFDEKYDLKFAEIMVFSGTENVALHRPAKVRSQIRNRHKTQHPRFLTDGFVPYLMDAARGESSLYFLSLKIDETDWLSIDLGQVMPLNRIHLHSVDPSYTAPHDHMPDFYVPRKMRIEGALRPDFSDARLLVELNYDSMLDVGPILMTRFPETECRYVRLTGIEPYADERFTANQSRIGFAEIELFSRGENAALGKKFTTSFDVRHPTTTAALTDGLNYYGEILPVRGWMNELARRHDLENERPLVADKLNRLYARQKKVLTLMRWLLTAAVVGIGLTILTARFIRMRTVIKLRERIAANLHDELAANLHAVALLGERAKNNIDSRPQLEESLDRIEHLSKRSRIAARHCTNMLQANSICEDLEEEMKRAAERLLVDTRHSIAFEGAENLPRLPSRRRIDLFLFYKECLINIARHARATECSTSLSAAGKTILLRVTDNGAGLTSVPESLKRRARLLGARISMKTPKNGGTEITLALRCRLRRKRK